MGEGTQDTRRRVRLDESLAHGLEDLRSLEEVIDRLADARPSPPAKIPSRSAHEALIREWPTLREWIDSDREGLRLHRHLTAAAQA